MAEDSENTLISHLEALRTTLIRILAVTAILYIPGYFCTPYVIRFLVRWSFPEKIATLHYFAPMEVFWVQLKLALIVALVLAYPWNIFQVWLFLKPALFTNERKALGLWTVCSTILFATGVAFCIWLILPLLMQFSGDFSSNEIRPIIGIANFLHLAGWLMLSFGVMFQAPIVILSAVRFGVVSAETLARKRSYVIVIILILAALLTPPDVVSQLMLAIPTWLLFEAGLFFARRIEKRRLAEEDSTYVN